MDAAAKKWIQEYKKLFDQVAARNAGMNVVEDVTTVERKEQIKKIGKLVDDPGGTATQVPKKVIKKIGKIVPEESAEGTPSTASGPPPSRGRLGAESNKKTASGTKVQDSGERFAIHYPKFTQQDIDVNIKDIALMESVKNIPEDRLQKTGKKPKDIYQEFFDSLGNSLYSPIFGDIELSKSSAKSEVGHGNWSGKIASIEAIPDVILKGKVIFYNTKGDVRNNLERIVVAAPIKIGNEDYYMGVMLQRDPHSQRLYLHNVLAIKNEEAKTTSRADRLTYGAGEEDSNLFMTSILQNALNVKLNDEKILAETPEALDILTKPQALSLIQRGIKGDDLLNASDLAAEIIAVGGKITDDAKAVLYHGTTKQSADNIRSTGKMYGKEDGLFFSTKRDGIVLDYGKSIVEVKIPLEKLILDDIFDDEAHLRMPVKQFKYTDVEVTRESFDSGERFALADGKRATAGEVAAVKSSISKRGIDPKGIIAIADKYFARYSGQLTRTGVRYEFLAAADMLFDLTAESGDRAYASVEALAEELVTNEKDTSGMTEDIKEMKRHIREITFEVREWA